MSMYDDDYDPGDYRCMTCDCRYCGDNCNAYIGNVYVAGRGWVNPETAHKLEAQGRDVRWEEKGFLPRDRRETGMRRC